MKNITDDQIKKILELLFNLNAPIQAYKVLEQLFNNLPDADK
jgi:hypothetical protein